MTTMRERAQVGRAVPRVEGPDKVTGRARYAGDLRKPGMAYGWMVPSIVARGRVEFIDVAAVLDTPGVLAVLHAGNAPKLGDPTDAGDATLRVLQNDRIPHRGAPVALVIADTPERAREGAETLPVEYASEEHDVLFSDHHPKLYKPDVVNPAYPTETRKGDPDSAMFRAEVTVDAEYTTPAQHNAMMEPHAAVVDWDPRERTLVAYDSSQHAYRVMRALAGLFSLDEADVRVVSEHVGGGFGAKGQPRPHVVLAAMASMMVGRPVAVTLTRPQTFYVTGYRTPTAQRVRLGARRDGHLVALDHVAYEQTSTVLEFAEQTATYARSMYATDTMHTDHRVVALDVPTPRWMRAPGESPGSFGIESALDELAEACGVDPVELRIRNDTTVDPTTGVPFSSRRLVECLREGARRFGWADRDPRPGVRRDGRWRRGTGMAGASYPARTAPSTASATAEYGGGFTVRIGAADIGTGARTALTQLAADALGVSLDDVDVLIADSAFGPVQGAGGSMGTASWSWPVVTACRDLVRRLASGETVPPGGLTSRFDSTEAVRARADRARHAYGAHFVEVAVDPGSGEVRVPRMVGTFAVGRVVNPLTARSQLVGGMTMGVSIALFEESTMDGEFGDFLNHNLADYHIASNADVRAVDVAFIEDPDDQLNPSGVKGLGEVGIVGVQAAVANAVWHATGVRQRELPITPARVVDSRT